MTERFPVPDLAALDLVDILRVVADPVRLAIVVQIADGEPHEKRFEDWELDISRSTLAYHFKALREGGLTRTIIDGRTHRIELRRTELDQRFPGLIAALSATP